MRVLLVLLILLSVTFAAAQSLGTLEISVLDKDGPALAQGSYTIFSGQDIIYSADFSGQINQDIDLEEGNYVLEIEAVSGEYSTYLKRSFRVGP